MRLWPILAFVVLIVGCQAEQPKQWSSAPPMKIDISRRYVATVETDRGPIEIELAARDAPNTVNNFVFLAQQGFYEGVPFHRVVNGFMIQTGDPSGTGHGGPGYRIIDEPVSGNYDRGAVAMANAGVPNTGGSQFFIVQGENVFLPKTYTIFGKVTAGMEVVDAIAGVPVGPSVGGEVSAPQQPPLIQRVRIAER
jgi:peptidylprolyl isomerase